MKGLQLPHSTRVAIAAGTRTPRFIVSEMNPEGLFRRNVPEHDPLHKQAILACHLMGQSRITIEGFTYKVQEA